MFAGDSVCPQVRGLGCFFHDGPPTVRSLIRLRYRAVLGKPMTDSNDTITRAPYLRYFFREEHQYAPFVGSAFMFALGAGFPLGVLLAYTAAQGTSLDGRFPQLVQVHGHIQLFGWFGLFVMGMGYRLVSRFTAVKHR